MKKWIFIIICFFIAIYLIYDLFKPIDSTIKYDYTINLKSGNIYVGTLVWGVSGGHDAIVFSSKPIELDDVIGNYDPVNRMYKYKNENDILVYYQPEIYYEARMDTLFIYSMVKPNGKLFENTKTLVIIPIECKVNEWYTYKNKYEELGLVKIETYSSK